MTSVARILEHKGHDVASISPDASVYDAIAKMAEIGVGALLVMDGDRLAGIISERDYARKVILQGKSSKDTPVRDIMSSKVCYLRPENTVEQGMALMTERRIRHLPVLSDDRVVGILSIGDLVNSILSDKDELIDQLEHYITGR
jgi:CBS domain-containing protein